MTTTPATVAADGVLYERCVAFDKRIAHGDDFAGDAWVRWVAVGHVPADTNAELTRLRGDRTRLVEALRDLREAALLARTGAEMSYDAVQRADSALRDLGELGE